MMKGSGYSILTCCLSLPFLINQRICVSAYSTQYTYLILHHYLTRTENKVYISSSYLLPWLEHRITARFLLLDILGAGSCISKFPSYFAKIVVDISCAALEFAV